MTRAGDADPRAVGLTPREIAETILLSAVDNRPGADRVLLFAEFRMELDAAETLIRQALASAEAARDEAVRRAEELEAEIVLLDEVCGHYAIDEARFLRDEGEPYGSVPIEAGMKAREAGRRYAEREKAEITSRVRAAQAVIADAAASDDDKYLAEMVIEAVGYAEQRLGPLLAVRALTPGGAT